MPVLGRSKRGNCVEYYDERPRLRDRWSATLDKLEATYLRVLRTAILLIATLLIAGALALSIYSLFKVMRSPASVKEETAAVAPEEIVDAEQPTAITRERQPTVNPAYRNYYNGFITRYHQLFRNRFEPFRQRDDKQLSVTEFGDNFVQSSQRLEAIKNGELNFEADKNDLESLLQTMTTAAEHETTQQRLKRYMNARKVRVCHTVQRTRTVVQRGWDRYSTDCNQWYEEPMGCAVTRAVEQPYSVRQCSMEFPPNTQSHAQIFRAMHDKYLTLLHSRREANAQAAAEKRAKIVAGQSEGAASLFTSLQILGAFLILMFFFLLIAIERHLRRRVGSGQT